MTFHRKTGYSHRYAWEAYRGPIPVEMHVLHKCDTPACVNIEHLFLGTQLDNIRDMDAKGRRGDSRNFGPANGRYVDGSCIPVRESH